MTNWRYLGKGIYSIPDVSKYTGISTHKLYNWTRGYRRTSESDGVRELPPVHSAEYSSINGQYGLSFLDLIEIRFINAFRELGVSLQTIRKALDKAKEEFNMAHPFSSKKFLTDGKAILCRVQTETNDVKLRNLLTDQYEIEDILRRYLREGLEFTPDDLACRWWPIGIGSHIVLDPKRNLGKSIVDEINIPTATLYNSYQTEDSISMVAWWYEIEERYVKYAVDYEQSLAS